MARAAHRRAARGRACAAPDPARGGEAIPPPVLATVVADEEPWGRPEWRGYALLLRHPDTGRVPRDSDTPDLVAALLPTLQMLKMRAIWSSPLSVRAITIRMDGEQPTQRRREPDRW